MININRYLLKFKLFSLNWVLKIFVILVIVDERCIIRIFDRISDKNVLEKFSIVLL